MNGQQKQAWFTLAVVGLSGLAYFVLGLAINFTIAFAGCALLLLCFFTPLIGRGEKQDERDRTISRQAALGAGLTSYATFVFGCVGTFIVVCFVKGELQVSVFVLSHITLIGGMVFFLVWAVAILVLYGRHVEADHA